MCKQPKDTNAFAAYEKAIEGYQFQVGRYNTWMNYYAIFVGALFVALYSLWPKSEANAINEINNVIIGSCNYKVNEVAKAQGEATWGNAGFLLIIISVLGWLASIFWYGALLGYRKWNEHWIKIVQNIEGKFANKKEQSNPTCDLYFPVYRNLPKKKPCKLLRRLHLYVVICCLQSQKKLCKLFRKSYLYVRYLFLSRKKQKYYVRGYISTQKITGIFVFCVAWAWTVILCYIMWENGFEEYWMWKLVAAGGVTFLFIKILFHWVPWCIFCSSIPKLD